MLRAIPRGRCIIILGLLLLGVIVRSSLGSHFPHDWFAAVGGLGGELGQAYPGTQGDRWDALKDMRSPLAAR